MKICQALLSGFAGLSLLMSPVIQPLSAISQQNSAPDATDSDPFSQQVIDNYCAESTVDVEPGIQFDGNAADPAVIRLEPGSYVLEDGSRLLIFPNKHFFIKLPVNDSGVRSISGTSGPDFIFPTAGVMGGCSAEHLSEVIAVNNVSINNFTRILYSDEPTEYNENTINEFCAKSTNAPQLGFHFDGAEADPAVMTLAPGRYEYPNEGVLLFFSSRFYLLQLPTGQNTIYGSDGDDLFDSRGLLGGCSSEQLSEVITKNNLLLEAFELDRAYE